MQYIFLLQFLTLVATKSIIDTYTKNADITKRDIQSSKLREDMHVHVFKYFSGRYKSIPVKIIGEEPTVIKEKNNSTTIITSRVKTYDSWHINMEIFGGYFSSLLGLYLSQKFEVTTEVSSTPPYAVVHYFFPGELAPPHNTVIEKSNSVNCSNVIHFCVPNSLQICLSNNTIYCLTPLQATMTCFVSGTLMRCLETKLKLPCEKEGYKSCERNVTMHIPCYATIHLVENWKGIEKNISVLPYCATIIAYPIRKYTNHEFIDYINRNEDGKRIVSNQANNFMNAILNYVIH